MNVHLCGDARDVLRLGRPVHLDGGEVGEREAEVGPLLEDCLDIGSLVVRAEAKEDSPSPQSGQVSVEGPVTLVDDDLLDTLLGEDAAPERIVEIEDQGLDALSRERREEVERQMPGDGRGT